MDFVIREYQPSDEPSVLRLAEKYASWDATSTRADLQGFAAREPDLFLVAEMSGRVVGFVYGQRDRLCVIGGSG